MCADTAKSTNSLDRREANGCEQLEAYREQLTKGIAGDVARLSVLDDALKQAKDLDVPRPGHLRVSYIQSMAGAGLRTFIQKQTLKLMASLGQDFSEALSRKDKAAMEQLLERGEIQGTRLQRFMARVKGTPAQVLPVASLNTLLRALEDQYEEPSNVASQSSSSPSLQELAMGQDARRARRLEPHVEALVDFREALALEIETLAARIEQRAEWESLMTSLESEYGERRDGAREMAAQLPVLAGEDFHLYSSEFQRGKLILKTSLGPLQLEAYETNSVLNIQRPRTQFWDRVLYRMIGEAKVKASAEALTQKTVRLLL